MNENDDGTIGTTNDGPIWSVFGVYEDEEHSLAIFHVHAQSPHIAADIIEMEKSRSLDDPDCWLSDTFSITGIYAGALMDARQERRSRSQLDEELFFRLIEDRAAIFGEPFGHSRMYKITDELVPLEDEVSLCELYAGNVALYSSYLTWDQILVMEENERPCSISEFMKEAIGSYLEEQASDWVQRPPGTDRPDGTREGGDLVA